MKKSNLLTAALLILGLAAHAQVKIGDNPTTIGASSALEIESTNKGLVIPRVANTAAIANPVEGMIVFDLSSSCFKGYQNGEWTGCGLTPGQATSILQQIGNEGDSPNIVPSVVTVAQLQQLPVTGVNPAYQTYYQNYIDANPNLFSSPATVAEVQAMINAVNTLVQIGNEGDSPDAVNSVVTVAQINQLPVTGAIPGNETAYQDYIDANPGLFSSPATVAEVQNMINIVNTQQTILQQIGNEGDSPDTVNSVVTIAQLNQLPVTGVNPAYQTYYQDYIDANPALFSAPATVPEVQAMINTVNAQMTVLQQIGNEGDSPNAVPSVVTIAQLQSLPVTGVNPTYQTIYQNYIDNNPNLFSSPATVAEVQAMLDMINASVTSILQQIGNEGDSPNTVPSVVTISQLQQLPVTGINPAYQVIYQNYIDNNPNLFSSPATVAEVQAMLNAVNSMPNIAGLTCGSAVFTPSSMVNGVAYSGTFTVPYTGGNGLAYPAGSGIASTGVTGLTATLQAGTLATGAGNLTYTVTGTPSGLGTASFAISFGIQSCAVAKTVTPPALPANITLSAVSPYFIASVYDQDYLPYTTPIGPATLATNQPANGVNETTVLNRQGMLTTTGVTINIPFTRTGAGSVSLPAYSQTINIPPAYTEDGIARNIIFSYSAISVPAAPATGYISANLRADGGTLNVKRLDLQTGIGNDYLGFLLAQFIYSLDNSGNTANFQVRTIPGIPDRNIADGNHSMLYLPVLSCTGKTWLNNNLGADYANTAKTTSFNLTQQATAYNDYRAYGSMFQWGRQADGHELVNWASNGTGTFSAIFTGTSSATTVAPPNNNKFLAGSSNWYSGPNPDLLWQGENGTNNPCPVGYRIPTRDEMNAERNVCNMPNTGYNTIQKFVDADFRRNNNGSGGGAGGSGSYWTSTSQISGTHSYTGYISGGGTNSLVISQDLRANAMSVRCIKD